MKYPIYSYRDNKSAFGSPILEMNEYTAIRGFSYAINAKDGLMNAYPGDYDLYKVGEFDSEKGVIDGITPVLVVTGMSVYGAK